MVALISWSSHWVSAQSVTCIWVLSLTDFMLTSRCAAELILYSNSALLPAPEVKLSKMAFMASEDIVCGAVFSGHHMAYVFEGGERHPFEFEHLAFKN